MNRLVSPLIAVAALASTAFAQTNNWISLFDGKSLDGWQTNESAASWVVEDGALVTKGPRSHLFYVGDVARHNFKNFEFSAEVMTTPGSNSGIYIHTRMAPDPWPVAGYECQIFNSSKAASGQYSERKMTGSIYAVRNTWTSAAADNSWFEYRVKVSGKTIQTFINNELICQYTEGAQHWRADDKKGRRLSSGTFALQAHDPSSTVRFRNVRVRLLSDDAPSLATPMADLELDELISRLSDGNFALIDIGLDRGTAAHEIALGISARRYGITPGFALSPANLNLLTLGSRGPVLVINDSIQAPTVAQLKAAKAAGQRIVFSSGGATRVDPARLKARFHAILDAGLAWQDLWAP